MSRRSDDDDLADLLRDLERDLDRLTDRLDADEAADRSGDRDRTRRDRESTRRRAPDRRSERGPRPPSPGDLLRFTEEYTIPTVVSVLEATIQSLELLRGGLRLADPTRRDDGARESDGRERGRVDVRGRVARELGGGASVALERTLSDLRAALSAADLPENGDRDDDGDDAREILEDARSLTDEIERRLGDSTGARDAGRTGSDDPGSERTDRRHLPERGRTRREGDDREGDRSRGSARRGVGIEVRDADDARGAGESDADGADGDPTEREATDEGEDEADDAPEVDVDAELESIRREVGAGTDADETENDGGDADETGDESDEGRGDDESDDAGA